MAKSRMVTVVLQAMLPANVTAAEFRSYVRTEVKTALTREHAEEPLHYLDRNSVRVMALCSASPCKQLVDAAESLVSMQCFTPRAAEFSRAAAAAVQAVKKAP